MKPTSGTSCVMTSRSDCGITNKHAAFVLNSSSSNQPCNEFCSSFINLSASSFTAFISYKNTTSLVGSLWSSTLTIKEFSLVRDYNKSTSCESTASDALHSMTSMEHSTLFARWCQHVSLYPLPNNNGLVCYLLSRPKLSWQSRFQLESAQDWITQPAAEGGMGRRGVG